MNKSDYLADILSVSSATENQNLKMRSWYSLSKSSKWGLDIIFPIKASFWGLDTAWVACPHFEGMNSEIKATLCRFDLRLGFVGWFYSLPFIRNHGFARNGTKAHVFKAFRAFSKTFQKMLKKGTVNLSLKIAILCFRLFCRTDQLSLRTTFL